MPDGVAVMPGIVPRLSATPGAIAHSGAALGADNHAIYGGLLGLSDAEMASLVAQRVI